jgi:hypothetical protein
VQKFFGLLWVWQVLGSVIVRGALSGALTMP